jgi:hypothetical protein
LAVVGVLKVKIYGSADVLIYCFPHNNCSPFKQILKLWQKGINLTI